MPKFFKEFFREAFFLLFVWTLLIARQALLFLRVMGEVQPDDAPALTFCDVLEQSWFATYLLNFIDTSDVLKFAACCRGTRVVRLLRPNPRHEMARSWDNPPSQYSAHDWQQLDLLGTGHLPRAHSVFISCEWKDQGWGNRKGMLSVVKDNGKAPDDYQAWSDAVVCGKEPAPHEWENLKLSFRVAHSGHTDRHRYRLCARAGSLPHTTASLQAW